MLSLKRIVIPLAIALTIVVVATVLLLYTYTATHIATYTLTTPSKSGEVTTPPLTTTPLYLSEKARKALQKLCGVSNDVLILAYLVHKPRKDFSDMLAKFFENLVYLGSRGTISLELRVCTVSVKELEGLGIDLEPVKHGLYPVIGIASSRASMLVVLRNMSIDIDGIMFLDKHITTALYAQQALLYGDTIPIEIDREPNTDPKEVPVIGSRNARFYIYIYEDVYCPFCAEFYNRTLPVLSRFIDNGTVALVLKNLIVHRAAKDLQIYIQAAYMETGNAYGVLSVMSAIYEELLKYLRAGGKELEKAVDREFVAKLIEKYMGVSIESLTLIDEARAVVESDTSEAISYGITGTPGFVVWDRVKGYGIVFVGYRSPEEFVKLLRAMSS